MHEPSKGKTPAPERPADDRNEVSQRTGEGAASAYERIRRQNEQKRRQGDANEDEQETDG